VIQSQTVNLLGGYNVVYIRMFRNRATVLTSNDPAALPPKPQVLAPQTITNPVATLPKDSSEEVKPKEGMLNGFKKLFSFGDAPPENVPIASPPAISPTPSPASSNMDGLKPDEQPNLLNSLQQLFN
jgi:hypothetical protein